MNKETGGPAFPIQEHIVPKEGFMEVQGTSGMTMRDYFAAKAMQGLFAAPGFNSNAALDAIARDAYKLADAMLLERAK